MASIGIIGYRQHAQGYIFRSCFADHRLPSLDFDVGSSRIELCPENGSSFVPLRRTHPPA